MLPADSVVSATTSCDTASSFEPLWTLVAVFLGFLLGEGSRLIRKASRISKMKRTLRKELESIKSQIPQKVNIVNQVVQSLKQRAVLPGTSVATLSIAYQETIGELYLHLTPLERNCLHVIYERVRLADKQLDNFKDDFLVAFEGKSIADPFSDFAKYIGEIGDSYRVVDGLIDSYLKSKPIDIFRISQK